MVLQLGSTHLRNLPQRSGIFNKEAFLKAKKFQVDNDWLLLKSLMRINTQYAIYTKISNKEDLAPEVHDDRIFAISWWIDLSESFRKT